MRGFQENVTVDEGVSAQGVRTQFHFEGDSLIVQRTYDAEPHLRYAEAARQATEGQRWGEGKLVGHIPPAEYARFLQIKDNQERKKAIKRWLQENPAFCMFPKYLQTPQKREVPNFAQVAAQPREVTPTIILPGAGA